MQLSVSLADLKAALADSAPFTRTSAPVYLAGSGFQLKLVIQAKQGNKPRMAGVYLTTCSYECGSLTVAPTFNPIQVRSRARQMGSENRRNTRVQTLYSEHRTITMMDVIPERIFKDIAAFCQAYGQQHLCLWGHYEQHSWGQ
jgi:hypothetical protein